MIGQYIFGGPELALLFLKDGFGCEIVMNQASKMTIFQEEHQIFRESFRRFIEREIRPHQERWRALGKVDREVWQQAGYAGFLCPWVEARYGGPGGDFLHSVVIIEELAFAYESGLALSLHSDICAPYIQIFGTEEQKLSWLPRCASGDWVLAIAMTEPGAGSDLSGISTRAVRSGDGYVLNGAKTFVSNGLLSDAVIVAAKTGPDSGNAARDISLFVVEAGFEGFKRGAKLAKLGMQAQDTAEISFEDCRIPMDHRLGEEGAGFPMMMRMLQQERLIIALAAQASAEQILRDTVAYCMERRVFGRPLSAMQNTQFKLAECATMIEVGRAFIDKILAGHLNGQLLIKECSMAKLWHSEMLGKVVDECVQLFGGYGCVLDFPVARAFADARILRIYGGTSEIMKVIIANQLGLQ